MAELFPVRFSVWRPSGKALPDNAYDKRMRKIVKRLNAAKIKLLARVHVIFFRDPTGRDSFSYHSAAVKKATENKEWLVILDCTDVSEVYGERNQKDKSDWDKDFLANIEQNLQWMENIEPYLVVASLLNEIPRRSSLGDGAGGYHRKYPFDQLLDDGSTGTQPELDFIDQSPEDKFWWTRSILFLFRHIVGDRYSSVRYKKFITVPPEGQAYVPWELPQYPTVLDAPTGVQKRVIKAGSIVELMLESSTARFLDIVQDPEFWALSVFSWSYHSYEMDQAWTVKLMTDAVWGICRP